MGQDVAGIAELFPRPERCGQSFFSTLARAKSAIT